MADYSSLSARDPGLLNVESVPQCIVILKGIQTFMQCLLVNESFCWMVYNCTIVIYSICRSLMMASYSIKVNETRFLIEILSLPSIKTE